MNKYFNLLFLVAAVVCSAGQADGSGKRLNSRKKEITIMTYNVRNCRGLDNKTDY